jgi:hypothetical protein
MPKCCNLRISLGHRSEAVRSIDFLDLSARVRSLLSAQLPLGLLWAAASRDYNTLDGFWQRQVAFPARFCCHGALQCTKIKIAKPNPNKVNLAFQNRRQVKSISFTPSSAIALKGFTFVLSSIQRISWKQYRLSMAVLV